MDSLAACPSPRAIKETLERLPKDLPETYKRMLQSILPDLKAAATRLLQFIVHSQRPLTVPEAVEVIATEIGAGSQHFDIDRRVFDGIEVLRYCPGLISIIKARDHRDVVRTELHLAHFSVKEYLETEANFKQQSTSIVITHTCLTYLTDITDTHQITRDFPMAQFAAEIWTSHGALAESDKDVFRAILIFLQEDNTFQRWGRLHQADQSWNDDPGPPRASRLYYACLGGLARVAEELIIKGADINAQGGRYGNAVHAASYEGHDKIVELLLDNGANINAQGGEYGNALQAASYKGHDKVMELLLDKGENINARGGEYGNALYAALSKGHDRIVELLLDKGANINAQGGFYGNTLYAASYEGHDKIVERLLDKGVNVNAQGGEYGNALQAASYKGHDKIGANVNAQGGRYGNALHAASCNGHDKIMELLLDKGANVNAQGGEYDNAVQAASSEGHDKTVELLLDKGANVNAQ
ncbi:hypothetical protein S40285_09729, partial [Stachybotrys chlorohalonatus IBT 40285]